MRSTPVIVGTVSSAVLIGAGVALHFLTPPDLEGRFRTAIGSVQAMQQLGAEWSVETARVRADPTANFDGLAAFVPRMHQLNASLTESLADIPSLPERLAADSRAYLAAMESLRERVERFKTAYAVIRNSERYFPLASADLMLRAEQAGNQRLSREIADISVEMDTYLSSPSVSSKNSLSARLQALTGQGASETEEVAASIQNFAAHANVLLDRRARSQELFRGITSSTLSERTKPLTDVLETELEDRRRVATLHRQALTGLGASVLLVWVGVGFARRSSASRRARLAGPPSKEGATSEPRTEPGIAQPPESSVEIAGDPHRDDDGMDAMEALIAARPFGPMHSDARAHDDADGHRDNDGMDAMDAMESLVSAQAPGAAHPGAREGGASGRTGTRIDVMEALLTGGALAGLMGQTVGGYARRIREDANVLVRDGDDAQTGEDAADPAQLLRRLRADARRIGFFAHRLVLLGRHLAPKDREGVDLETVSRRSPERRRGAGVLHRRAVLQGGARRVGVDNGRSAHPGHVRRPRAAGVPGHGQGRGRARGLDGGRGRGRHDLLHPQRSVAAGGPACEPVRPVLRVPGSGDRAPAPRRAPPSRGSTAGRWSSIPGPTSAAC